MKIPKIFTEVIENTFYDKTVSILENRTNTDTEGGITYKGYTETKNFKGNVSFSNCKSIQEEYGLDYDIDIAITSNISTNVNINDIIKYNDVIYNITDVLKFDSHVLIVAVKWRQ